MKVAICSGTDDKFFPFLRGMLESLSSVLSESKRIEAPEIIVFDDNLSASNKKRLPESIKIVSAKKFNFRNKCSAFDTSTMDGWISCAVRPYLPDFTDADIILWFDADVWFQDHRALDDLVWAAQLGAIAAIPEVDRLASYVYAHSSDRFERDLQNYFRDTSFKKLPILNCGVFAAHRNSPVWSHWQKALNVAIGNFDGVFQFGVEQAALNYAVYKSDLPFVPLPYTHNYNARLMTSVYKGALCFNTVPFEKISIVHMIGDAKWTARTLFERNEDGQIIDRCTIKLDYFSMKELLSLK